MKLNSKALMHKEAVLDEIKDKEFDVLLTMGAGNIDTLVEPIKNLLNQKYRKQ